MEPYGSLWKMQVCSIGKLGKHRESGPESNARKEGDD